MMEENTKEKIARLGFQLIREKGYDHVTINEICQEAKISKHTFYYYFKSKEDILTSAIHFPHELKQETIADLFSVESPLEQLIMIVTPRLTHIENCGPEIAKKLLLYNLTNPIHKPNAQNKKQHPLFDLSVSLVKKAQTKGEIKNSQDPEKLVLLCFMMIAGMCQAWATSEGHFKLTEKYLEAVKTMLDCTE